LKDYGYNYAYIGGYGDYLQDQLVRFGQLRQHDKNTGITGANLDCRRKRFSSATAPEMAVVIPGYFRPAPDRDTLHARHLTTTSVAFVDGPRQIDEIAHYQ
jgi:hypothetical protein